MSCGQRKERIRIQERERERERETFCRSGTQSWLDESSHFLEASPFTFKTTWWLPLFAELSATTDMVFGQS